MDLAFQQSEPEFKNGYLSNDLREQQQNEFNTVDEEEDLEYDQVDEIVESQVEDEYTIYSNNNDNTGEGTLHLQGYQENTLPS